MWLQFMGNFLVCLVFLFPFWLINTFILFRYPSFSMRTKKGLFIFYAITQLLLIVLFGQFTYYETKYSFNETGQYNYDMLCKYSDYASICIMLGLIINIFLLLSFVIVIFKTKKIQKRGI